MISREERLVVGRYAMHAPDSPPATDALHDLRKYVSEQGILEEMVKVLLSLYECNDAKRPEDGEKVLATYFDAHALDPFVMERHKQDVEAMLQDNELLKENFAQLSAESSTLEDRVREAKLTAWSAHLGELAGNLEALLQFVEREGSGEVDLSGFSKDGLTKLDAGSLSAWALETFPTASGTTLPEFTSTVLAGVATGSEETKPINVDASECVQLICALSTREQAAAD